MSASPVLAGDSSIRERNPDGTSPTSTAETADLGDTSSLFRELPEATSLPTAAFEPTFTPTPTQNDDANDDLVRPKPTPREFDNPAAQPTEANTPTPTEAATAEATPSEPVTPRLDDSVLRWLPEIVESAKSNNVPAELIAGVMRLESDGNPNIISPDGARGLMQIMPDQLLGQGISEDLWHDPKTNIQAGGYELLERSWTYGQWEGAVGSYFGFGCDVFGTCTETYVRIVFQWAAFYAPIIASPYDSGYGILPADWQAPPIEPFVEAAPVPPATPPASPTPSETPTPTGSAEATQTPTAIPPDSTEVPTDVPTEEPTLEPTEIPTEEPTEIPTDPPTEEPTDPPIDEGTPAG